MTTVADIERLAALGAPPGIKAVRTRALSFIEKARERLPGPDDGLTLVQAQQYAIAAGDTAALKVLDPKAAPAETLVIETPTGSPTFYLRCYQRRHAADRTPWVGAVVQSLSHYVTLREGARTYVVPRGACSTQEFNSREEAEG